MVPIIDFEKGASRLRRHLKRAQLPELRLLCGLRFFDQLASHTGSAESYIREFVPALAEAAKKSDSAEFLPEEFESLCRTIEEISTFEEGVVGADDLAALEQLRRAIEDLLYRTPAAPIRKALDVLDCLFVEYYPDLDLPPRGRLLNLRVGASPISSKAESDDIVVRNPIDEPDDRFLTQARDSIKAARQFLSQRYRLSLAKRYRFDFAVDSTGARLTGDSLGVAFAVGAIAAIGKIEVFREQLSPQPGVAFSGALLPDGTLAPVDSEALRLKIYRSFHSRARCLVVPANHLSKTEEYVRGLEDRFPDRKLKLIGADKLTTVLDNAELVQARPLAPAMYYSRRVIRTSRSVKVQIPLLGTLILLFAFILSEQFLPECSKPWGDCNPEYVQITQRGFQALNADSVAIWGVEYQCDSITDRSQATVGNLDGDVRNEVIFCPHPIAPCEANATLFAYDDDGTLLFRRPGVNSGTCSEDTTMHIPGVIDLVKQDSDVVVVTKFFRSHPAHTHIRTWNALGDSLGWYWHRGFASGALTRCFPESDNECFLFRGIYNPMGCASIFALDLDSCYGFGPSDSCVTTSTKDNQKYYRLFAKSDVGIEDNEPYNGVYQIYNESNQVIRADVGQFSSDPSKLYLLSYWLNNELRVTHVAPDDRFVAKRNRLVAEGKLHPIDWSIYCAMMRDSVKYWTDSGWVSEGQLRAAESPQ